MINFRVGYNSRVETTAEVLSNYMYYQILPPSEMFFDAFSRLVDVVHLKPKLESELSL